MKIVKPIEINKSRLLYSSIPEPDVSANEIEWKANELSEISIPFSTTRSKQAVQLGSSGYVFFASTDEYSAFKTRPDLSLISSVNIGPGFVQCIGESTGALHVCTISDSIGARLIMKRYADFSLSTSVNIGDFEMSNSDWGVRGERAITGCAIISNKAFFIGYCEPVVGRPQFDYVQIGRYEINSGSQIQKKIKLSKNVEKYSISRIGDEIAVISVDYSKSISGTCDIQYFNQELDLVRVKKTNIQYKTTTGLVLSTGIISATEGDYIINPIEKKMTRFDVQSSAVEAYSEGDEVIKASTHRRYRSAKGGNIDDPELGVTLSPPTWVDIGPTNKWAMFDKKPSIQTVNGDEVKIIIRPGKFTQSISGFNLSGVNNVNVKVIDDADGETYSRDIEMNDSSRVVGLLSYFTSPIVYKSDFTLTNLPAYRTSNIELTMNGSNIRAGAILVGDYIQIGRELAGTSYNSNPITIRTPDGFGGFDITRRGVSDTISFKVGYQKPEFEFIRNTLKSIDGLYCVFIGEGDVGAGLTTYGLLDPFNAPIETPTANELTFDVIGVL